jgi:hypothetical protein
LLWRNAGRNLRSLGIHELSLALNPRVFVSEYVPIAALQRAKVRECALCARKVHLYPADAVALELVPEALRMRAEGPILEQWRVTVVEWGDAIEVVGAVVQGIRLRCDLHG